MENMDTSTVVDSIDTLLEFLEERQERPCHNSFLDLNEPVILDDLTYTHMQFKKYR